MTDFFENFSDEIEENAGAYAALGGLATLRGQEIRNKKLDEINALLAKAENRVEREALVMRKLVDFESNSEIFSDETKRFLDLDKVSKVLESEGYKLAMYGKPSNLLTELESIKFAKKAELKAKQFTDRAYVIQKYKGAVSTIDAVNNLAYQLYELSLPEALDQKFEKNGSGYYSGENVVNFVSKLFAPSELDFLELSEVELSELREKYKDSFMQEDSPICVDFTKKEITRVDLSSLEQINIGEIEVGKTYRGIVRGVKDFGAFVECLFGKVGLVHISELADYRVSNTEDICKVGDEIVVKCVGIDNGKVSLSRKAALEEAKNLEEAKEGNKSCFVATAIYGDQNHPQVQKLRNFRDARLNNSIAGRHFIKFYYAFGPTLALLPRSSKLTKRVLRHILDRF